MSDQTATNLVDRYRLTFTFKSGRQVQRILNEDQFNTFKGEIWQAESQLEQVEFEGDNPVVLPIIVNLDELESVDVYYYRYDPTVKF